MKKWMFAGVALLLAFAVTLTACEILDTPGVTPGDGEFAVEEFGANGELKSVTLNLNGGGPSLNTKRALTNPLARINHDFFEVVFYYDDDTTAGAAHTAPNIARTSWSRGEGAALSVYRGGASGINYGSVDYSASVKSGAPTTTPDTGAAILLVGKKESGRYVLLGVGKLISTTKNDGTAGVGTVVTTETAKVTFEIVTLASAIFPDRANLSTKSSFYTIPDSTSGSYNFGTGAAAINAASTADNPGGGTNFVEQIFDNVKFPLFMLNSVQDENTPTSSYYAAKFTFTTATTTGPATGAGNLIADYVKGIVAATPASHQYVDDEVPAAVIINGEKRPKSNADNLGVTVVMKNNNDAAATGNPINPEAYFIITVPGNQGGMMAFNFNIPVYGITSTISNNGGIKPVLWLIQPGLERLYVDNGTGLGGSILLGLGDPTKIDVNAGFKN